mmetsp:Transcript_39294/g.58377  ORF Transcript_39294/g.58377 Transcript_39294/m.58377 type:complete len:148 (+) Transcript_39294:104-547(+)
MGRSSNQGFDTYRPRVVSLCSDIIYSEHSFSCFMKILLLLQGCPQNVCVVYAITQLEYIQSCFAAARSMAVTQMNVSVTTVVEETDDMPFGRCYRIGRRRTRRYYCIQFCIARTCRLRPRDVSYCRLARKKQQQPKILIWVWRAVLF